MAVKGLLYPIFGLAVLGGYAALNVSGVDPFAAGTERTMGNPEIRAAAATGGAVGIIGASGRRSSGFRRGK